MASAEPFMTVKEYAAAIQVSATTIYRNPEKFHMFKVGGCWRASVDSMKKFEQQPVRNNNAIRLAAVDGKEKKKCRSTNEGTRTGLMYRSQTARELDALLAPKTKPKRKGSTTK